MYNRVKRTAEEEKELGACIVVGAANGEAAGGKGKKKRLPFLLVLLVLGVLVACVRVNKRVSLLSPLKSKLSPFGRQSPGREDAFGKKEKVAERRTRDFCILARDAVHERGEFEVVRLADRLGLQLDIEEPSVLFADHFSNLFDRLLEAVDRALLVGRVTDHDVQGRGDQPDLDGDLVGRQGLAGRERLLDPEDAVVGKVGDFNVGTDLDRLRRQSASNVGLEFGKHVVGNVEAVEHGFGLPMRPYRVPSVLVRRTQSYEDEKGATHVIESLKASYA